MKESMKALTERSDEDEGSDSEPSVDNYEQDELEENLRAALDELEEGETNPFESPFVEENEPSVKAPSEKDNLCSDDNMSLNSVDKQILPKEEVASQADDEGNDEDKDSSTAEPVFQTEIEEP